MRPITFLMAMAGLFLMALTHCSSEKPPASVPQPATSTSDRGTTAAVNPPLPARKRISPVEDTRPVIVALGNSLTAGYGLSESQAYPARLQSRLDALGYRYRVINAGVSGDTTAQGLNRLQIVLDYRPKIVIVELGPNDGLRGLPIESTKKNLEEIVRRCQESGAKVLLAGMTLPTNYGRPHIQAFEKIYTDVAETYRTGLIPFLLEGVAMRPELNLGDQIHPNAAGYEIVAETVLRYLKPLL